MPPARGRIRIAVLNYNGGAFVLDCLAAIARLDWPADELDVVLVDNASTDGSRDEVATRFPDVRIIDTGGNEGFVALNRALADLDGIRYVGLVNNDAFVEPGWLRPLVEALDADPGLGAASSRMVFAPRFVDVTIRAPAYRPGGGDPRSLGVRVTRIEVEGIDRFGDAQFAAGGWGLEVGPDGPFQWTAPTATLRVPVDDGRGDAAAVPGRVRLRLAAEVATTVHLDGGAGAVSDTVGPAGCWVEVPLAGPAYDVVQNAGSIVLTDGSGADRGFGHADGPDFDEPCELFAWCGGSVLLRPAYLEDVGVFDERFFLYYEDTDLSWRGRARGWRYRYVPDSRIRHLHAGTTGEGSAVFTYYVERNRLLMLTKNAPAGLVARTVVRFLLATASYARRDVVGPVLRRRRPNPVTVRRRLGAFAGYLRLLPHAFLARWRTRRRRTVPDAELLAQFVRPEDR